MGFFKNFVDTFAMQGYTVYIAGESYAGYYVPYFADAFLNANDTTYYNLSELDVSALHALSNYLFFRFDSSI